MSSNQLVQLRFANIKEPSSPVRYKREFESYNVTAQEYTASHLGYVEGYNFICASAHVFQNRKMLLVERAANKTIDPNSWEVPGGKYNYDTATETIIDTALRELKEETGLDGKVTAFVGSIYYTAHVGEDDVKSQEVHFIVQVNDYTITLNSENQAYGWYTLEEARNMDLALKEGCLPLIEGAFQLHSLLSSLIEPLSKP